MNQPPKMKKPRGHDFDAATLQALAKLRDALRTYYRWRREAIVSWQHAVKREHAIGERSKAEKALADARSELDDMLKEDD